MTRADWPLKNLSRQVRCRPHDWHVQDTGVGPTLLLLHGAGASTHSWRRMIPELARDHHVVAIDLPGHGSTRLGNRHRSGLEQIAADVASLCAQEGWNPTAYVAHSAGAPIALRLSQKSGDTPVFAINPALMPFDGMAGVMFPIVARTLTFAPFAVDAITRFGATRARTEKLLVGTGSRPSEEDIDLYQSLFSDRAHVDGTLLMMAQWKLDGLLADLPRMGMPALFLTGASDKTVPPRVAAEAAGKMMRGQVIDLRDQGHLLHEADPIGTARHLRNWLSGLSATTNP